jgi:transcription initiation factor TFIIIB Brf1 subunit/transcription initiation factor TFIIB
MALTQLTPHSNVILSRPMASPPLRPSNICPECKGSLIQTITGVVCDQCGLVHDPTIYETDLYPSYIMTTTTDPNPYLRWNSELHNPIRSQFTAEYDPLTLSGYLHPKIDIGSMTPRSEMKKRFFYLSHINTVFKDTTDYAFYRIWEIIIKVHQYIPLSFHVKRAIIYHFKKIQKQITYPISNRCHILACCIYYCICKNHIDITPSAIVNLFCKLGHPITLKTFRHYQIAYNIVPPTLPDRFVIDIHQWCRPLTVAMPGSQQLAQIASEIFRMCLCSGLNRSNLAAASIYAAAKIFQAKYNVALNMSQKMVGTLTNKSGDQIQTTYKKYIAAKLFKNAALQQWLLTERG